MALKYGFYPSTLGSTKYYTDDDVGEIFDGLINDGVYMDIGDRFKVTSGTVPYQVKIGTGRAWFNHTYSHLDEPMTIGMSPGPNMPMCVVLMINKILGKNLITSMPEVAIEQNTGSNVFIYKLATVSLSENTSSSVWSELITIKNHVGTSICPYVTGIIQQMSIDDIVSNWQNQWNQFMTAREVEDQEYQDKLNDFYSSLEETSEKYLADANQILEEKGDQLAQLRNSYVTQLENVTSHWNDFFEESQNQIQNLVESTGTTVKQIAKKEVKEWTDEWGPVYMQQHIEDLKSQYTLLPLKSKVLDENGLEIVDENGNPITATNQILVI